MDRSATPAVNVVWPMPPERRHDRPIACDRSAARLARIGFPDALYHVTSRENGLDYISGATTAASAFWLASARRRKN
jgi:hypothetical protein